MGLGCRLVAKCFPNMHKVLCLIPAPKKGGILKILNGMDINNNIPTAIFHCDIEHDPYYGGKDFCNHEVKILLEKKG